MAMHLNVWTMDNLDHLMQALFDAIAGMTYDIPRLQLSQIANRRLLWSTTLKILDWVQSRRSAAMNSNLDALSMHILTKTTDITNHIYAQILTLTACRDGKVDTISIIEPFLNLISQTHVLESSRLRRFTKSSIPVKVSEDLLAFSGVKETLAEFLTHPIRSPDLYICAQEYHMQFAEICLELCNSEMDPS